MQILKSGCSFDIGNIRVVAADMVAQPSAAVDMCEAILHLQYDFVLKVVADFVLSNQSNRKRQAQHFTPTLSWRQIAICAGYLPARTGCS